MTHDFEIIKVFDHHNRGQFIFARQLDISRDFEIKDGATFGGIAIFLYVEIPRVLDENQQPRLDVFVFRPLERFSSNYFKEGQIVQLIASVS